jgi:hypothetical protein
VTFRVPINRLRFKDPIPAGMDAGVLLGLVPMLRKTAEDPDPILVGQACPTCDCRVVLDGRHRWVAAVIAGRADVLATEHLEESPC